MLVLTRRTGQSIAIGKDIKIIILKSDNANIRIGIEAPKDITILRNELIKKSENELLTSLSTS